jgi:hypothetical protein
MIDYKDLLKRYLHRVMDCEGAAFIDDAMVSKSPTLNNMDKWGSPTFTQEEFDELSTLAGYGVNILDASESQTSVKPRPK